jgi:hypothetical protein
VELAPEQWSPPARSCSVSRPLPADELPVPAEQRLGADEQPRPGRTGQDAAQGREQNRRLPARAPDLAFEYAELMAKGQDVGLELELRSPASEASRRKRTNK